MSYSDSDSDYRSNGSNGENWLSLDDFSSSSSISSSDGYSSDDLSLGDACIRLVVTGHKHLKCSCNVSGNNGDIVSDYNSSSVVVKWFEVDDISFTTQTSDGDSEDIILISDLPKKVKLEVKTLAFDMVRQWSKGGCYCDPLYTFCPSVTIHHEYSKG